MAEGGGLKLIEINNLSKSFRQKLIIDNLSVEFYESQITCLISPSGAGKTTLFRILLGLEKQYEGEVKSDGVISVTFQEDRLFDWLSARQNIELVSDKKKAQELLERVKLIDEADKYPSQLSGGMCRRVALARCLAFKSDIILLDEPFKGLDTELKGSMYDLICEHTESRTVIMTTHDVAEAATIADRVIVFSPNGFKIKKDIGINTQREKRSKRTIKEYLEIIED